MEDSVLGHKIAAQKDLLLLLKERSKEDPNVNSKVEESILSSMNKQDYLDIVNRLSLTKKNNLNSLVEVLNYARDAGRYGIPVGVFEDAGRPIDEKLRIFMVDLNKMLKGVSDSCASVYKSFKKIKDNLSQFKPKIEPETSDIRALVEKISNFRAEIQSNIYSISKTSSSQTKIEAPTSNVNQSTNTSPIAQQLQDLRVKVASLHDSAFKITETRSKISKEETDKLISSIHKVISEPKIEMISKSISESDDLKDKILTLLTNLFLTRSLSEMKNIEKQFDLLVGKRLEYLQIKNGLKFFIRDREEETEVSSPTFEKGQLKEGKVVKELEFQIKVLKSNILRLEKEINKQKFEKDISSKQKIEFKDEVYILKGELSKRIESELRYENENKKLEQQLIEARKELQAQRVKFSHLDRSTISMISQDNELINYRDIQNEPSPSRQSPSNMAEFKDYPSPGSYNRTEIMMDVVQKYELLEQNLRKEREILIQKNSSLTGELQQLKHQMNDFFIEINIYKNEIKEHLKNKQSQQSEIFHLKADILKISTKNKQLIQSSLNERSNGSQAVDNSWMQDFFIEENVYKGRIQRLTAELEEYKSIFEQFWIEQKQYKGHITQQTAKIYELQQTLSNFFIEESLYKNEIQKLRNKLKEVEKNIQKQGVVQGNNQNVIQNVLNRQRCEIRKQIQEESQQQLQSFFANEEILKAEIRRLKESKSIESPERQTVSQQQMETLLSNEETLKYEVKKLNEILKQKTVQNLSPEHKEMIEQFWIQEKRYKGLVYQLNEKIYELEKTLEGFFIEQRLYQEQIKKCRTQIKEMESKTQKKKDYNKVITQGDIQYVEAFFIEEKLYKAEIIKLKAENQEYKATVEQFWIEQRLYKNQIQKYIKKLQEKPTSSQIPELNIQNQGLLKPQIERETVKIRAQIQDQFHYQFEAFFANEQIFKGEIKRLRDELIEKDRKIKSLELSLSEEKEGPRRISQEIIQKTKLLKQENKVLQKIQKSKGSLIQSLQTEIQNLKLSVAYFQQSSFFQADIFEDNQSQKSILIKLITEQIGRNIFKTKLLYKFDSLNKVSYHSYVDNHESFIVLVQTKSAIVGGYYSGVFGEKSVDDKSSFLFSVDESQCYPCIAPGKAITYDQLFFIMGNSQIKVNLQNRSIFSNFGSSDTYYDSKGKEVGKFLREGESREAKFDNFEIYTVEFQEITPVEKDFEEYKEDEDSEMM